MLIVHDKEKGNPTFYIEKYANKIFTANKQPYLYKLYLFNKSKKAKSS